MEEIDLKELFQIFWKKRVLIVIVIILFAICGFLYTDRLIVPLYQSSTTLVLVQGNKKDLEEDESISYSDLTLNSKLVQDYKEIASSKSVAKQVITNLNLKMTVKEFVESVTVSNSTNTEIIDITVSNQDPVMACKIANEIANVSIEISESLYNINNIHVLDVAEENYEPYNVHYTKNIAIFAFIGAILVGGYILLINMLDTTIKSDADIEKLGLSVLASIALTSEQNKVSSQKSNNQSQPVNFLNKNEEKSSKSNRIDNVDYTYFENGDDNYTNYTSRKNSNKRGR